MAEEEKILPEEPVEIFDDLPKEVRRIQQTMMMFSGRMNNSALAEKITPEHIDKNLDNQRYGMELQFKDHSHNRWLLFAAMALLAGLAVIVLILFREKTEMIEKIMVPVITGIVGAAGGYGFGKSKRE